MLKLQLFRKQEKTDELKTVLAQERQEPNRNVDCSTSSAQFSNLKLLAEVDALTSRISALEKEKATLVGSLNSAAEEIKMKSLEVCCMYVCLVIECC